MAERHKMLIKGKKIDRTFTDVEKLRDNCQKNNEKHGCTVYESNYHDFILCILLNTYATITISSMQLEMHYGSLPTQAKSIPVLYIGVSIGPLHSGKPMEAGKHGACLASKRGCFQSWLCSERKTYHNFFSK